MSDVWKICMTSFAKILHSWLGYWYEITEIENLVAEDSLKIPISNFMERKSNKFKMKLEYKHPIFSECSIDLGIKQLYTNTFCFVEFKYFRIKDSITQKIMNDLFRLALIQNKDITCYFLLCGRNVNFGQKNKINKKTKKTEQIAQINGKNVLDKHIALIPTQFDAENKCIFTSETAKRSWSYKYSYPQDINKSRDKNYYRKFVNEYFKGREEEAPCLIEITTTLLAPLSNGMLQSMVGLWKIESRLTFRDEKQLKVVISDFDNSDEYIITHSN